MVLQKPNEERSDQSPTAGERRNSTGSVCAAHSPLRLGTVELCLLNLEAPLQNGDNGRTWSAQKPAQHSNGSEDLRRSP